jgi:hypothetical protein
MVGIPPNSRDCLSIYTVFDNPTDYQGQFVVRRFESRGTGVTPCEVVATGKSLTEVRDQLPKGLMKLDRHPNDDPNIVETWL